MDGDSERRHGQVCNEEWRKEPPLLSKERKSGGRKTITEANLRGGQGWVEPARLSTRKAA